MSTLKIRNLSKETKRKVQEQERKKQRFRVSITHYSSTSLILSYFLQHIRLATAHKNIKWMMWMWNISLLFEYIKIIMNELHNNGTTATWTIFDWIAIQNTEKKLYNILNAADEGKNRESYVCDKWRDEFD